MNTFTIVFLGFLSLTTLLRLWLGRRHIVHVLRHRSAVPVQFAERITLASHQKAADYTIAKTRLSLQATVAETALLLALTLGGGLQALHGFWQGNLGGGLAYGLSMVFSVVIISALVDLPFAVVRQFGIEARFGFNRMTFRLFAVDLAKQAMLGIALGGPVVVVVLWLMEAMGNFWWLYVWLFWAAFNLLILFIYPIWIAPLFNKFSPLQDDNLKTRIESLLTRCGFHSKGIFVMDGSKRSSHGNAYFAGFGQAKRIVFFDTLLERLQPDEIEAVLAHELGHFRRRHVVKRIAVLFALSLAFLWLLGLLIVAPWFYQGLGVSAANTAVGLILFFLTLPVFTFVAAPVLSLLSRRHEFEADAYAASHASGENLVRALVKLYDDNAATLTPDPLHSLFYDSHPPAAARIGHLQSLSTT